jgi:hypothetical protein
MKYVSLVCTLICAFVLVSCGSKFNTESSSTAGPLTANLSSNSLSLGIVGGASAKSDFQAADISLGTYNFNLVQISTDDVVTSVLNRSVEVYSVFTTSNYVVASGHFINVEWPDGVYDCFLIRFAKDSKGAQVECLSKFLIGTFYPETGKTNPHYSKIGIKQRGETLYYVTNDLVTSYLYKLTDGDKVPTLILSKSIGLLNRHVGFSDVFVDNVGSNLCVMSPALSADILYYGNMFCGSENSGNWVDYSLDLRVPYILADSFQFGNYVLTSEHKINLSDLSITSRSYGNCDNGGLSFGYAYQVHTPGGGLITNGYAKSINFIAANGDSTSISRKVETDYFWNKVLGSGNYAWTYGSIVFSHEDEGDTLKRIPINSPALESTNYISQTGLVKITDMLYQSDGDSIVVKGLNANGDLAYAKISSDGTVAPFVPSSPEMFLSLFSL